LGSVIELGPAQRAAVKQIADSLGLPSLQRGWVWLAGAGPGDPGLASLHTVHAITEADVILTDALASPELLRLARPDARIVDAGKRGGKTSHPQAATTRQMI
jgi:uroporphyrin-III C-methyltransferase